MHSFPRACVGLLVSIVSSSVAADLSADVVVFCANPAGVAAAVGAARAFKHSDQPGTVLVLEPSAFLGGMASAGGIGLRDVGLPTTVGGIAREWALLNGAAYGNASALVWQPDNYIGEASFQHLLASEGVPVLFNAFITGQRANRRGTTISSVPLWVNGSLSMVSGSVFIDACYEGDFLGVALANSSSTLGREAVETYGESMAGVGNQIIDGEQNVGLPPANMSAYDSHGNLWPFVAPFKSDPPPIGSGDTRRSGNAVSRVPHRRPGDSRPLSPPAGYNETTWDFLAAWVTEAYLSPPSLSQLVGLGSGYGRSGNKVDPVAQYNTFGLDFVGEGYSPDGTPYALTLPGSTARADIVAAHRSYSQGWFWTLAMRPRVPLATRADVSRYGLCGDEWVTASPPHWPPQLHVREARALGGRPHPQASRRCRRNYFKRLHWDR